MGAMVEVIPVRPHFLRLFLLCLCWAPALTVWMASQLLVAHTANPFSSAQQLQRGNQLEATVVSHAPSRSVPVSSPSDASADSCEELDFCMDRLGFDAIRALHRQLDDDANGNIDIAESDEFLRDELQYEDGYERQKTFHGNDKYISVDELWRAWKTSEVHNWTIEETIEWLVSSVELPQYVRNFQDNAVDGTTLPRMAINSVNFLTGTLGIKDPIHKHKLVLKAMDVVLFGPPKHHNYVKDVLLVLSLVIAIGGCWFAYVQHKYAQTHLRRMMKDMDSLSKAEEALFDLQQQLDKAKHEQEIVAREKQNLERRLQDEITSVKYIEQQEKVRESNSPVSIDLLRVTELEEELHQAKEQLHHAQEMLESRAWTPSPTLQHWLQLTHELELRHYSCKKTSAEQQLAAAKEGCEKLKKRRSTFLGSLRVAHGSSIDDVDSRILQAKASLLELTHDLQERTHRWRQIELLCGVPIVHNSGLPYLQALLHPSSGSSGSVQSARSMLFRTASESTILEEDGVSLLSRPGAVQQLVHTSAAVFLAPVPPTCSGPCRKLPPFSRHPSRDSGISLLTANQLTALVAAKHSMPNGSVAAACSTASLSTESWTDSVGNHVDRARASSAPLSSTARVASDHSLATEPLGTDVGDGCLAEEEEEEPDDLPDDGVPSSPDSPRPHFIVGDSIPEIPGLPPVGRRKMVKSFSHDRTSPPHEIRLGKASLSESNLDAGASGPPRSADDCKNGAAAGRKKKTSAPAGPPYVDPGDDEAGASTSDDDRRDRRKKSFLSQLKKRKPKIS